MKKILLLLANGFEAYEASVFTDVLDWNTSAYAIGEFSSYIIFSTEI